jgi:hypothetical protein
LINVKSTTTIIVFFLVGFLTSFFVKNMIIVIVFAMFVAWLFEGLAKPSARNYLENFSGKEGKENFKFDYQGQANEDKEDEKEGYHEKEEEEEEEEEAPKKSKGAKEDKPKKGTGASSSSMGKSSELKKDMEEYFGIQKELLDLLAQAEPLQAKAEQFKEKFNNK